MNESPTLYVLDDAASDGEQVERWMHGSPWVVRRLQSAEALRQALGDACPDVLLLDYSLPGVDGWEVLDEVRGLHPPSELAVVVWTGVGSQSIAASGMRGGAQDYLVKGQLNRASFWQALERALVARDTAKALSDNQALLRVANEALAEANEELGRFAAVAAHDLKNPLRRIAVYGQLLRRELGEALEPGQLELLEAIEEDAIRLRDMVSQLLQLARAGASSGPAETVDLAEAFRAFGEKVVGSYGEVRWDSGPTYVRGNRMQLGQVFVNLLDNALHYRSDAPLVVVGRSMVNDNGDWQIDVVDNGRGFPAVHASDIFETFRRLDGSSGGTGLGLSIVQRVIEQHGGRVWATSELGKGATFSFTLPRA